MSAPAYEAQLRALVDAVTVVAPDLAEVVTADGRTLHATVANALGPFRGLAAVLYEAFYSASRTPVAPSNADPAAFAAALRAANAIPRRFSGAHEVPREMVTGPGGHYVLLGRPVHDAFTGRQVRFYWNIAAAGGPAFVHALSTRFEHGHIPFQAKLPLLPHTYARIDTGVLYLSDEDVEVALDAIAATYAALGGAMRPDVPLFTLAVAPGLGFAESPPNRDSFGMHRCDLIAEGLVRTHERGVSDPAERLEVVKERLTQYGLDTERLAFNPHSRYPYRLDTLRNRLAA
ncbi:MAG: T3SS effector HopA1 family protein [Candidatus Eremiobacteraeota bacterium]|nr:T3SS effector HopA1 family protein [Candidatus Eremiobacteraeota bacterium]